MENDRLFNKRKKYVEWLVAIAVMFITTFTIATQVLEMASPFLLRIANVVRYITILLLLKYQIRHYGVHIRGKGFFAFFLLYIFYLFLYITVFSVYKLEDLANAPKSLFSFFAVTLYMTAYLLCAETIMCHLDAKKYLFISFFTIILPSIFLIQYIGIDTLQYFGQDKDSDDYISPLEMGYRNGPLIVISLLMYNRLLKLKWLSKLFALMMITLASYILGVGGERGPIIWTIGNLLVCLFLMSKNRIRLILLVIMAVILLLANVDNVIDCLESVAPHTAEKMESTLKEGDTNGRFDTNNPEGSTFIIGLNQFASSPIYGSYFRLITNHRAFRGHYPHNIFIEILMTMGLLGFIPFAYFLFKGWKRVSKVMQTERCSEAQLCCLVLFLAWFLQLQTSKTIVYNTPFWLFFYIMCIFDLPIIEKSNILSKKQN